jgi:hypothetical protein
MTSPERSIPIQIDVPIGHPALLSGLENWLRLGLISDRQVRELCQQYLVSPLSVQTSVITSSEVPTLSTPSALQPVAEAPEQPALEGTPSPNPTRPRGWASSFLQRLINEVSVIWLLCLGVFLVVISSGVLAASQWQHFSPAGQYGILFGYTIAFVVVGLWTGTQQQLQLTSAMLQITSLLIIPVNFWMMDGFKLLQTSGGIGIAAVASLLLSAATVRLLPRPKTSALAMANVLGLSWLHWGWSGGGENAALLATYVGCIGTSLILLRQQSLPRAAPRDSLSLDSDSATLDSDSLDSGSLDPDPNVPAPSWLSRLAPADILLPFAVLLLLFRACVVVAVPLDRLGLAFGICGWLLCWLARHNPEKRFWAFLGVGLLVAGWAAGLGAEVPWQSVLTGGLGLWLLGDRLLRDRQPTTLVGLEIVGLVTVGLGVRLVPQGIREAIMTACIAWAGPHGMPDVLWSVGLYPYLWCLVALAVWLRRWQSSKLVRTAYGLAWILGGCLVLTSLANPMLRSLSLWLAFGTLVVSLRQRSSIGQILISIVHTLGLAAVFSTLDNVAPGFEVYEWGLVALAVMVFEWSALPFLTQRTLWQKNVWYTGLGFAALGYLLLLVSMFSATSTSEPWRSAALVIPTALTALLFLPSFRWQTQAMGAGIISAVAVQLLTFDTTPPRLIGLALGAGLMFLGAGRRPNLLSTALSVGFGITFGYATGWEVLPQTFQSWVALSAGLLLALVGFRQVFARDGRLNQFLRMALDGWAVALTVWTTLPLTAYGLYAASNPHDGLPPLTWVYPVASVGILVAWIYRFWQKAAQSWLVGVAWTAEVAMVCTLSFWHVPLQSIAVATLALGLFGVLLGEARVRTTGQPYCWSWNLIPLGYGAFGWLLSNTEWTGASGLYTLTLAAIAIGVGRRQPQWRPITIVGLVGLSVGAFELVLYPLLKAQGGQSGDAFLALGALAIGLAVVGRLSDPWGTRLLNLPSTSLSRFGHFHWGLGSVLLAIALSLPLSPVGERLWGLEFSVLGGYALIQGRQQTLWIYFGLSQIFVAVGQALHLYIPEAQLLPWASAIASGVSLGLYSLPWPRWGWPRSPFYHFALAVPFVVTFLTTFTVSISSLLLTGGFYAWMAFASQTVRLSYVGLLAANWAALRLLTELHLSSRIWGVSLVGLSMLFIAQIDPTFRASSRRDLRHWLRCFAIGLISTTILYESDPYFGAGLLAIGLSLGLVLLGLLLRIRAFLYVGTLTFVAKILRLVWLFIADESLVLWALGIALGLLLIWIAATFEARRAQVTALLQYWVTELDRWQ